MSIENKSKLNQLLSSWPRGAVYVTSWLGKNGIRFDLVDRYRRSNWVYAIGRGAVARSGDRVDWTGGLYAIQNQMGKKYMPVEKQHCNYGVLLISFLLEKAQ